MLALIANGKYERVAAKLFLSERTIRFSNGDRAKVGYARARRLVMCG